MLDIFVCCTVCRPKKKERGRIPESKKFGGLTMSPLYTCMRTKTVNVQSLLEIPHSNSSGLNGQSPFIFFLICMHDSLQLSTQTCSTVFLTFSQQCWLCAPIYKSLKQNHTEYQMLVHIFTFLCLKFQNLGRLSYNISCYKSLL